jgi:tRNA G18 (ribose-2'-O)-methylase SpoU
MGADTAHPLSGGDPAPGGDQPPGRPDLQPLDDPDDPRLADYVNLRSPELRRVWERQRGVFVAEGHKVVARLLSSPGWNVRSLLVAADRLPRILAKLPLLDRPDRLDVPVLVASQPVIDRVTGFNLHRGLLAAADRPVPRPWAEVVPADGGRLLVIEEVNDQENLGSLFRSAAALDAAAVLVSPGTCDPLARRTVRVSMGAVFRLPFATVAPWPAGLHQLAAGGWQVVALTPDPHDSVEIDRLAAEVARDPRVALVVGSEGPGLSSGAAASAAIRARIPMSAGVDSLNVAVAAAIGLHALRRR